jgi:hypothetical protein
MMIAEPATAALLLLQLHHTTTVLLLLLHQESGNSLRMTVISQRKCSASNAG